MDNLIKLYEEFLMEAETSDLGFTDFAKARLAGATKIAETAKERGGPALLTYHHFIVKLPYYKKAAAGKFKPDAAKKEMDEKVLTLTKGLKNMSTEQIQFQKIVGIIEVLGELLIKYKK